jgi:hypothetical protein
MKHEIRNAALDDIEQKMVKLLVSHQSCKHLTSEEIREIAIGARTHADVAFCRVAIALTKKLDYTNQTSFAL